MSTLHIFAKPASTYAANVLANLVSAEDRLLLVSDACYSAVQFRQFSSKLYLLKEDAIARDILIDADDTAIEYDDFVDLTLNTDNTISW